MSDDPVTMGALLVPGLPSDDGFDARRLTGLATRAEKCELARLAVSDHLLHRFPAHDPVALLGATAVVTTRIRLATSVMQLPLRHPVQVAQSITTVDHLSGGRVELGVGVGGEDPSEYRVVGQNPRQRGRRADEALALLKMLWSGTPSSSRGRHFTFENVRLVPRPVQRPHPPIIVGGRSSAALRRAARFGDRWDGIFLDPPRYAQRAAELDDRAASLGRRVGKGLVAWISVERDPRPAEARLASVLPPFYGLPWERLRRFALWGPPDRCAEALAELKNAGAEEFMLIPVGHPERQLDSLAEIAQLLSRRPIGVAAS